jgi:hypothetical protein|nr:MAG TPA: hypothetical protein [Caudoviricetes sp.]
MYAGSFVASLKGIAYTLGFVILLACLSTSIFLLSPVEVFSLFRLHRTLYVAFPIVWGMPACLPHGWQATVRFRYAAQPIPSFAWTYSPKPPPLFPALNVMFRHDIAKSSG